MIIDTHAHLQYPKYNQDLRAVLDRAAEAGVVAAIVPGTDLESSRKAVALAEAHATAGCTLYATVGIHPTSAHQLTPAALDELRALAQHPRVVAIGETGLDYYWPGVKNRSWECAEPAQQRAALRAHLDLATELALPVVIHDRDAHEDTLRLLRAWIEGDAAARSGTLHAYAAGPAHLEATLALGFAIGMDGPVTFKKAHDLHAVARRVPLDRLLLETDAPYLTPHPHRGRRNEPAYLTHVAQRIAELRATSAEAIAQATTANAQRLFPRLKVEATG